MANILIIGDGAIGLLLSHFLSKAHTVHVLTRKATANTRFIAKQNSLRKKLMRGLLRLSKLMNSPRLILLFLQ